MENFSYHIPFYVVTNGVATSGHSSDLAGGRVGLFDRQTFSVATGIGNGKEFFFAQGATGGLDWYGLPVTESHKSPFFFGKDVEDMYLSMPARPVNEEWVIGYNGSPSSVSLSYAKGEATRIKFYFHGGPIYRFFNGPKEYVVSYTPKEDCVTPCEAGDCPEGIGDCLTHTQALIDLINTHTELRKFGVQAKLVRNDYVAATTTMIKWCLDVCDNGDALALQAVQSQAPTGAVVVRTGRSGSTSTYEMCLFDDEVTPTAFQQTGSVLLAICDECPAGSDLVPAQDVWMVRRPLAGTEDLSTANARQTYANAVGTAYGAGESITETFDGATGVDPVTNQITVTAHGWSVGQPVFYSDGGGTAPTGLTDNTLYYVQSVVDANNVTLSATQGGAVIDITADGVGAAHTLNPVASTFVGQDGAVAMVKIQVPAGTDVTALLADTVEFSHSVAAQCLFDAPASIAWTNCGTGIRSQRTLRIKNINRPDCDAEGDRIDDLTEVLAGVKGIQINTLTLEAGDACKDDYTVQQYSLDCLDEACLTQNVTFTYDTLPSFENNAWEVVPEAVEEDTTRKCGIRVNAGYIDPQFGNCSFNPMDYYEMEPIKMEVSLLQEDGDRCDVALWPTVSQSRIGKIGRQSGEYVVRELIMKTDAYLKHVDQFSLEPRMREAFDQNLLGMVDRKAYYKLYYVRYKASYGRSFRKNEQETFTTVFAFKESDSTAAFETNVIDVLTAKSGVLPHVNESDGGSSGLQS